MGSILAGTLEMELTSADVGGALAAINANAIPLAGISRDGELTCRFSIHWRDYARLTDICRNRGEKLTLLKKHGLIWKWSLLRKRPLLFAGAAIMLALVLYLPTRIFFVRVEGNATIPERKVLAAAENCGIGFGASRREVRSEKMKNALLSAVPELQWAGVNTTGCVAVISVREGARQAQQQPDNAVVSIVADRDGYILSGTVTQGNGLFQPGQTVREGQMLISGYTDCGLYIQAVRADGEILAQTTRSLEAVTPSECLIRGNNKAVKRKYSLIFRKKRINLWKDSGISGISCGRMYEEYYVTLPGGFQLPIALCVETYTDYDLEEYNLPPEEISRLLSVFSDDYLSGQMIAGTVVMKDETVSPENGVYRLSGRYICTEMIGRAQREQIGDINGKSG